jgi:hypothetical protein
VAKKKGARKPASRGARKKTATRRGARKAARPRTRAAAKKGVPGLEEDNKVKFKPIKELIAAHIDRLEKVENPSDEVTRAKQLLTDTSTQLSSLCIGKSMVIELP